MTIVAQLDNGLLLELFKVQLPIETNSPFPLALIYNEDRSVEGQVKLSPEMLGVLENFHSKGWLETPFKFYVMGTTDDEGTLQMWPDVTVPSDQKPGW